LATPTQRSIKAVVIHLRLARVPRGAGLLSTASCTSWTAPADSQHHAEASCRRFDSLCIEIFDTVIDHRGTALLGNPLLPRRQLVVLTARFPSARVMRRVAGALQADIEATCARCFPTWRCNRLNRPHRRSGISTGSPERHGGTAPSKQTA